MSVQDIITILCISCLFLFLLIFLICFIFSFSDSNRRKQIRDILDCCFVLRKVLKNECCINRTAGELFDELDDKIFELYKEY